MKPFLWDLEVKSEAQFTLATIKGQEILFYNLNITQIFLKLFDTYHC